MHLVYIDETGNTGTDLHDSQQPIFVLAALIIPATQWQALEADLEAAIKKHFPMLEASDIEIHATDLRSGRGAFKGLPIESRLGLQDEWLKIAKKYELKLIYRAIVKKRFLNWLVTTFGSGVLINPHIAAFPLIARVVNDYLTSLSASALGMFISDENKEIVRDVEKSIKVLRGIDGTLRLSRIVEKGFFIDSTKSRPLQLCDVCALLARKKEERKAGLPAKSIDDSGLDLIEPLIHRGNESLTDVLAWLTTSKNEQAQKK